MLFSFVKLGRRNRTAAAVVSFAAALLCSFLVECVAAAPDNKEEKGFYAWPLWARVVVCLITVLLSAMFCGLTIGLLGIDTVTLEIIASAGAEPEKTYAQKIIPIRHLGHQLLASLLLGNMLTLVLTSQLVAAIVRSTELVNFIVGTLVVLIFGEIIPMAYCNKGSNGLRAGVASLPVLKAALLVLYPIAKPLGMLLDCIISHDAGQLYDKNEIRKLIRVHYEKYAEQSGINHDELRMMLSALEMNEVTVDTAMTPLDRTLMLEASLPLDAALQRRLWEYGKSRVPVYAGTKSNIIGVLYVKDLINVSTLRADDVMTIRDFIVSHPRELLVVKEKAQLQDALKIFESHYTQMLFVEKVEGSFHIATPMKGSATSTAGAYDTTTDTDANGHHDGPFGGGSSRHYRNAPGGNAERRRSFAQGTHSEHGGSAAGEEHATASHHSSSKPTAQRDREREWLAAPDTISPRTLLEPESTTNRVFVGVVTLEDIIERLIASEILDEDEYNVGSDGDGNDTNSDVENEMLLRSVKRSVSIQKQPVKVPRVNFYSYGLTTDSMEAGDDLTEEQKWALAAYMTRAYVFFASWSVPKIKFLLDELGDKRIYVSEDATKEYEQHQQELNGEPGGVNADRKVPITVEAGVAAAALAKEPIPPASAHPERVLYTAGQPSHTFTLLLSGGMDVSIGNGQFRTEMRSFSSLGEEVFTQPEAFVPDYTAVVSRSSRVITISHEDMYRVERKINAIRRQRGRPPVKITTFDAKGTPTPRPGGMDDDDDDKAGSTRNQHHVEVKVATVRKGMAGGTVRSGMQQEGRRLVDE